MHLTVCHKFSLVHNSWIWDVEPDHPCFVSVVFPLRTGQTERRRVFCPTVVLVCPSKQDFLTCLADSTPEMYQIVKTIPQCTSTQLEWGLKPLHSLGPSFSESCLLHLIHLNNINRAVRVYGEILSHLKSLEQWCFWNDVTLRMQIPLKLRFCKKQ